MAATKQKAKDADKKSKGAERKPKAEPSFRAMADTNIAQARKSLSKAEGENDPMAGYLMRSAVVYAVLDLADAVRSSPAVR
jgi:hypothetical protein